MLPHSGTEFSLFFFFCVWFLLLTSQFKRLPSLSPLHRPVVSHREVYRPRRPLSPTLHENLLLRDDVSGPPTLFRSDRVYPLYGRSGTLILRVLEIPSLPRLTSVYFFSRRPRLGRLEFESRSLSLPFFCVDLYGYVRAGSSSNLK